MKNEKCVAIGFYGIPRSIEYTLESIKSNVIKEINSNFDIKIYCHFIDQKNISNHRTAEYGEIKKISYYIIKADKLEITPDTCREKENIYLSSKKYGDCVGDNFKSLKNLINQLYSLKTLTKMIAEAEHDICVFVRPDLMYHDSLLPVVKAAAKNNNDAVYLPGWQSWRGYNDRFAVCRGKKTINTYGYRIDAIESYCSYSMSPLNSHRLLKYVLKKNGINVNEIENRATRVRFGGEHVIEDFDLGSDRSMYLRIMSFIEEGIVNLSEVTRSKAVLRAFIRRALRNE